MYIKPFVGIACFSFTTMIIQIVSQSLVTHMKSSLILEELKWFNLVNGSGTFPTPAQVFLNLISIALK